MNARTLRRVIRKPAELVYANINQQMKAPNSIANAVQVRWTPGPTIVPGLVCVVGIMYINAVDWASPHGATLHWASVAPTTYKPLALFSKVIDAADVARGGLDFYCPGSGSYVDYCPFVFGLWKSRGVISADQTHNQGTDHTTTPFTTPTRSQKGLEIIVGGGYMVASSPPDGINLRVSQIAPAGFVERARWANPNTWCQEILMTRQMNAGAGTTQNMGYSGDGTLFDWSASIQVLIKGQ